IHHFLLVEALRHEVVHGVIGVVGGGVAESAPSLAVKQRLSAEFAGASLRAVEFAVDVEFGSGREIQDLHEFRHSMDLGTPFQDVNPFLGGHGDVAVEIGGTLFEFGKVLHGFKGPLRTEESLDIHSPEGGCLNAMPELLGSN